MDPCLGEVVDEQEEVARAGRRATRAERRAARAMEARRRLAAMILAERNRKDVQQYLEVFPEGTNPIDDEIISWARRRATFHTYQVTRMK